jgi:hypothetical protein
MTKATTQHSCAAAGCCKQMVRYILVGDTAEVSCQTFGRAGSPYLPVPHGNNMQK